MNDYPLRCDKCKISKPIKERKIYSISIVEISLNEDGDFNNPHKFGDNRILQICENCFETSDINKILINENRTFK